MRAVAGSSSHWPFAAAAAAVAERALEGSFAGRQRIHSFLPRLEMAVDSNRMVAVVNSPPSPESWSCVA